MIPSRPAPRTAVPAAAWSSPGIALPWVLAAAPAVAALTLTWLSRSWPLTWDTAMTQYVAARLLEGAVPYRDFFETGFPGLYLIHLGQLATLGPTDAAFRAFDLLALGGILAGVAAMLRGFGPLAMAIGVALFWLYHLAGGAWRAGQRDMLLCLPLAWMMVAMLADLRRPRIFTVGIAALLLGGAIWIKPHAALLLLLFTPLVARRRPGERGPAVAALAGGLATSTAIVLGWLAAVRGLGPFADFLLGYLLPVYSRLGPGGASALRDAAAVLGGLGVLALTGLYALWRSGPVLGEAGLLVSGIAYGALHYVLQGKGWQYHLYPFVLFSIALGAAGIAFAVTRRWTVVASAGLAVLLAVTIGLTVKGVQNLDPPWFRAHEARIDRIVSEVTPRLGAGRTVQVLDMYNAGATVLYRLGVTSPTPIISDFPLFLRRDDPYVRRLRGRFLAALEARPPDTIVVFSQGGANGYGRLTTFPELERFLATRYRSGSGGDGYRILVVNEPRAG